MPFQTMNLETCVFLDSQHDGRLWTEAEEGLAEKQLVAEIMAELQGKVEKFVEKVQPFSIHV